MSNETQVIQPEVAKSGNLSRLVEIMQVFSVLAIPVAIVFWGESGYEWVARLAATVAVLGFLVPFFLVSVPKEKENEVLAGPFEVTEDGLMTLEAIQIPPDVRIRMKKYMLNIKYRDVDTMKQALHAYCGPERVRTHESTIMLHTRVVDPPASPDPNNDSPADKELK